MNYEDLEPNELRFGILQRDQQLRDEIAKNNGYVKTLAANVQEICELKERLAQTVCKNHQWPYGVESIDSPICPWCERLRVEQLEQQLAQAQAACATQK